MSSPGQPKGSCLSAQHEAASLSAQLEWNGPLPAAVPRLVAMTTEWLERVLAVEQQAYEFPWSRGNFVDSLAAGYIAQMLLGEHEALLGYFVAMHGVDEVHLLNITVAPAHQRQGHARLMLDALVGRCLEKSASQVWLEVRSSNERAKAVYRDHGFRSVGVRRGYYPAASGREDATVMSLDLTRVIHALD